MSYRIAVTAICAWLTVSPAVTATSSASALEAVKASAEAARIAAEAAQAAADAAQVAADAAHIAVGGRPAPRVVAPIAPVPALPETPYAYQPTNPFVEQATSRLATAASVEAHAQARVSSGPAPGDGTRSFSRLDIEQSGEVTLADFLRRQSANIGGSARPTLGKDLSAAAFASTRALGAEKTLVLLNGRRIASTILADGTLAQNLTTLPLVAIERIDILPDGQSARFGEDAIGGVINLITRDGFEGVSATGGTSETKDGLDVDEHYSVVAGASGALGNVFLAVDGSSQAMPDRLGGLINDADLARDSAYVRAEITLAKSLSVYAEATQGRASAHDGVTEQALATERFDQSVAGIRVETHALGGITLDANGQRSSSHSAAVDRPLMQESSIEALNAQLNIDGLRLGALHLPLFVGGEQRRSQYGGTFVAERELESLYGGASLRVFNLLKLDYWQREDRLDNAPEWLRSQRYQASLALLPGLRLHGSYATGYGLASLAEAYAPLFLDDVQGLDFALCEKSNPGAIIAGADGYPGVAPGFEFPGDSPCLTQSYLGLRRSGPDLTPERSEHWRAGLSFEASPIALSVSAYRIELSHLTHLPDATDVLAEEWLRGVSANVSRDANNQIEFLRLSSRNAGQITTQGAEAEFRLGSYLDADMPLGVRIVANYVNEYLRSTLDDLAPSASPDTLLPGLRTSINLRYQPIDRATLLFSAHFIDEATNAERSQLVEEWFTVDAQLSLALPWRGDLTFGVRNLLDQAPPITYGFDKPYYNNGRYSALGFTPYVRYRQSL